VVRRDLLDYSVEVQRFDSELGKLLEALESHDLLEKTLVVATGDQGMPFPRSKTNLYDSGVRIPLAVMWKGTISGNRIVDDLIGQTDFAPTFLEAAGVEAWPQLTGRSFLEILLAEKGGRVDRSRDHVFVERERHGACREADQSYPVRGIRTERYLYLRNLRPGLMPAGDPMYPTGIGPFGDIDPGPTKDFLLGHRHDPEVVPCFRLATAPRAPEELYDCTTDPWQMTNLADAADFVEIKARLRKQLDRWMEATGDPRADGETEIWDKALYVGSRASPAEVEKIRARWIEEEESPRP
ncbi:MAG: sulfatase/phosphatase domain-containing protein, partial [Thermoguttaceae bacterium]